MRRFNQASAALATLVIGPWLLGCSADGDRAAGDRDSLGTLGLAVTLSGYTVNEVEIVIEGDDLELGVSRTRTFQVSDPNATISASEYGLPPGSYSVSLSAKVVDDPETAFEESDVPCVGRAEGIVVETGSTTEVNDLVLLCTQDGGLVQTAGGIRINAELETETINVCPDLFAGVLVAPLESSVNAEIAVATEHGDDVTVSWTANAGSFSADQSIYTCPEVPGTFNLEAEFVRDGACSQSVTEGVVCHSLYEGRSESLPTSFAIEGSCEFASPCQLTQEGNAWEMVCGTLAWRRTILQGEATGENSFPFISPSGSVCSAEVIDGELLGSCEDSLGETCSFETDSQTDPSPLCPTLSGLSAITTCTESYGSCELVQEGCAFLGKCDNGAGYIGGSVDSDGGLNISTSDGSINYRCGGSRVDGAVNGTCTQSGRGVIDPLSCDFSAIAPIVPAACDASLPESGFVLQGCGFDDSCLAVQNGCAWRISCSNGSYEGLAQATNKFDFVGPEGGACTGSVVDGEFLGSCQKGDETCAFAPKAPEVDESCYQLRSELSSSGCGPNLKCKTLQNGCDFVAMCGGGEFLQGTSGENGISFAGLNGFVCEAELGENDDALYGQCTRLNPDNSISECRDLSEQQGARLKISWPMSE
jgi:hypothetical protein